MNLFSLNRRSSFRNLLISLKVNKQKSEHEKKTKKKLRVGVFVLIFDVTSVFHFLKIYYPLPNHPSRRHPFTLIPFHFVTFFFISFIFSSPEANNYDEEDETGNPLTEDEGNGRLISDGACAITLSFCYFLFYSFHLFPLQRQTIMMKKMKLGIP